MTFEFNNRFHKHFKELKCLRKNFIVVYIIIKVIVKDLLKSFAENIKLMKFSVKLKSFAESKFSAEKSCANNFFNIAIIKEINVTNSRIIQFIVDLDLYLNINYNFRD